MNTYYTRVVVGAALASVAVVAGCRASLAQPRFPASPRVALPTSPLVLAQAQPAPTARDMPAPGSDKPIGLPRAADYEPIAALKDIYFDFGSAVIRPRDINILDANAAWLRDHPAHVVLIEGHCDNRGAANRKNEFNMDLGERRAEAAMNYLVARGVHQSRITILSYGEERPQCTEETEQCWSQNRRSRFLVKPR